VKSQRKAAYWLFVKNPSQVCKKPVTSERPTNHRPATRVFLRTGKAKALHRNGDPADAR